MTRARRVPGWLLLLLFIGVPLLEIVVLIEVGQVIGVWWTIVLLVADALFGAWLVRHEGSRAMRALAEALGSGRMPARELADGMLILAGGIMMLTPGFVTDAVGILLVLPMTRPLARRALTRVVSARLLARPGTPYQRGNGHRPRPGPGGPVIKGEVVDEDDD